MRHLSTRLALSVLVVLAFTLILKSAVLKVPTGTWQPTSNMQSTRANAAAVLVPDGRVVFTGGADANGNPTTSAEALSNDGTFSSLPPMTAARAGHAALLTATGDLLVTGGRTSGGGFVITAEVFDSLRNTWTVLSPSMVQARAGHTMSQLLDGNILIAGGEDSGGPVAALEAYSLTQGNFAFAGTLATARKNHAAAVLKDGRVLIVGGEDSNGSTLASTEIYDPANGTVSAGPNLAIPRKGATATTLLDGRVLVAAGSYPEGATQSNPAELASAEIFDPSNGTFSASASQLSTARANHLAVLLPNNNNVLIVGGTAAGADLASAELYVPWNDAFQQAGSMSAARSAAAASAMGNTVGDGADIGVDGMLAVAGGNNLSSGDVYGFATVKTDHTDYVPGDIVTITGSGWQPGETVTLSFLESPNIDQPPTVTAIADAQGNIFNNQFSPDVFDLRVRFYLTAVGRQSGVQAQNTFRDAGAANVNFATIGLPSGTVVSGNYSGTNNGGNPASGTWTLTAPGSSANIGTQPNSSFTYTFPTTITVSGVTYNYSFGSPASPFNTGADKSVTTVTGTYVLAQQSQTITVTTHAPGTAVYNTSFNVAATASSSLPVAITTSGVCSGSGSGSATITMTSGTGNCTVHYNQAGNANFNAAPEVTETTTAQKADQAALSLATTTPLTYNQSETLSATGGSTNGTVTYNLVSGPCTIGSSQVTANSGTGSCTLTATMAGDNNYNAVTSTPANTVTLAKASQTITFAALPNKTFGDPDFGLSATASSGLAVSFSATAGNCTVTGSTVHITGAGSCTITAAQAGDSNYKPATDVPQSFTIDKASQTITFAALPNKTFGDPDFGLSATASSGLAVSFSATAGNCTVTGSTVHITGAGSCTITAAQAGDSNYKPATDVPQSFTIDKASQTITFAALPNKTFGDPDFGLSATASSGLAVSFSATAGNCTVTGSTVHITGAGSCTITAAQAGDSNYKPATDVPQSFTIDKASQTITFAALPNKTFGDPDFGLSATASSGLAVSFSATAGNCTVTGSTVHITGAGSCTITAAQAGDSNYKPATDVPQSFTIDKASQTITFAALPNKTFGDPDFGLSATASSGLAVSFSATAGNCTVTGSTVHITGAGSCTITAAQAGDSNYKPATDVPQSFTIDKASQTITFAALPNKTFGDPDFGLSATASSGLAVSFSATAGNCTVTGSTVHITGAGSCTITAAQAGDSNYKPATDVPQSFTINKANATTTVTPYNVIYDGQPHTATGTAKGVLGETLSGLNLSGTTHTNPGDYPSDPWSFTDVTGNYNNASGAVHDNIHYQTTGACLGSPGHQILQPINADGSSVFKQGSTVPAKFRVCDAYGNSIGTPNVITGFVLYKVVSGTVAQQVDEAIDNSTNDLGWRFDPTAQQWIFNMTTKLSPINQANKTYYFDVTLNDGSHILFNYGLK